MKHGYTIDKVLTDPRLLGAGFETIATWATWLVVLKAAFGLPLTPAELTVFKQVAGGRSVPLKRVRELWAIVGRRGGKSRIAAALAVYIALFVKHRLAPGERGLCLVLAGSIEQARMVFDYARAFIETSPVLRKELVEATAHELRLRNGVTIATHSISFRTVRGRTLVAAIFDEVSFWRSEDSSNPDRETYSAVLPSLATTHGMLIGISSPYRKLGLLHQKHKEYFAANDDDVLVVKGPSKQFNGTLDDKVIANFTAADPTASASEWGAEFRADLSSFLDDAVIDAAVQHGRPLELPPLRGTYTHYRAFVDAAGGSGNDAYTIAIAHKQDDLFVIDLVRGTASGTKFDPQQVTEQYAALLKQYGVTAVTGDNYASEWVASAWKKLNVTYIKSDLVKSDLYLNVIPLFMRGLVRLPDHARLLRELRLLERATHRGGRDTVDHPRGGRDDHANVVAGVLHNLALRMGYGGYHGYPGWGDDPHPQQASADINLLNYYKNLDAAIRCGLITRW